MRGSRSLGLALVAAALGAAPALAQQQTAAAPPANAPANMTPRASMAPNANTPPNAPMANNENTANGKGPSGSLEKYNGEWRTSKVVGATVYNSNGDSIGTVDDLLMNGDGSVNEAVISTGGGAFGIGGKLVAVPFNQLKFEPSATNNNGAAPPARTANTTPNTQAANNPPANPPARVAANEGPSHPTYFSLVMPNATKDSLAKEQTFKYASSD
jgi:sporulation protein YlmC with PRC-barrel domain